MGFNPMPRIATRLWMAALLCSSLCFAMGLRAASAQSAAQTQVQVESLGQVEPFRVGARSGIAYNMPMNQWRGTSANTAISLISDLPQAGQSPLLNRLATSVLMSPSTPPKNQSGEAADGTALASLRLASLYRLGELNAVIDLAERSPNGLSDPENAAIATRAFLALGEHNNACETAIRLQTGREAVFWLKVRAFCLAREGQTAAAELTAALALEADPEDPAFLLALSRMLDKDTDPVQPNNALELAMADFAGAPINLAEAPMALQNALFGKAEKEALGAARRKASAGLLDNAALARAYMAWPTQSIIENELANAEDELIDLQTVETALLEAALEERGDIRAALLYQLAASARLDHVRAEAIFAGLMIERDFGGFLAAATLYADLLASLPLEELLGEDYGPPFTLALLAGGKTEKARALADNLPPSDDSGAYARLFSINALGQSLAPMPQSYGQITGNLAYIDLMALSALGAPLSENHRNFLFSFAADTEEFARCTAGARLAIKDGAAKRARAETFLRAALMLRDSGFAVVAPECGAVIISAFSAMGYKTMARTAALEMMLGPRVLKLERQGWDE